MATINRFEDLQVWQKARTLNKSIYTIITKKEFSGDYGLKDQIRRASISIASNIAEGFEREGNKEFIQYLYIAKGSLGEVQNQLYLSLDIAYVTQIEFDSLYKQTQELMRMIKGFIQYLKQSEIKGHKYLSEPESIYQTIQTSN